MNIQFRISQITLGSPIPPHYGGAIRMLQIARSLSKCSELQLIIFPVESEKVDNIELKKYLNIANLEVLKQENETTQIKIARYIKSYLLGINPLYLKFKPYHITKIIHSINLWKPKIIVLEYSYLSPLIGILKKSYPLAKYIVNCHNIESDLQWQIFKNETNPLNKLKYYISYKGALRTENLHLSSANSLWSVSESDRLKLQQMTLNKVPVSVIPNPCPSWIQQKGCTFLNIQEIPFSLGFVGDFSYPPNIEAASFLLSKISELSEAIPEVTVWLIGRKPPRWLCEAQSKNLIVTGEVENIIDILSQMALIAIPLFSGGGTRLKVIEAMNLGKAIVSTPKGVEGLNVKHGHNICISNSNNFVNACITILKNENLRKTLGLNAKINFQNDYDNFDQLISGVVNIYNV